MGLTDQQKEKYAALLDNLRGLKWAVVAFSGGVDSTFLLHAAGEALGENVLAVTFATPYSPQAEIADSLHLAERFQARHRIIEKPLLNSIRNNPPERCYLCKKELFGELIQIAQKEAIAHVLDGSNLDDLDDHRPGRKAVKELGIRSPLLDAGLTKQDIRDLSMAHDLPTWNKPAGACLLTRLPHGTTVDERELERIDKGEDFLKSLGFSSVRLRSHGDLARIEVPERSVASCVSPAFRRRIDRHLRELGYRHVAVDIAGYRMGSLNEPGSADI